MIIFYSIKFEIAKYTILYSALYSKSIDDIFGKLDHKK